MIQKQRVAESHTVLAVAYTHKVDQYLNQLSICIWPCLTYIILINTLYHLGNMNLCSTVSFSLPDIMNLMLPGAAIRSLKHAHNVKWESAIATCARQISTS